MRALLIILFVGLMAGGLAGQGLMVSRFVPGDYLRNNEHQVVLFNQGNTRINVGGYYLITRAYSVRLPAGTVLPPRSTFTIAKRSEAGFQPDLSLYTARDFLIRFPDREDEGDYLILFDRQKKIVEAVFYTPSDPVPFLPERVALITSTLDTIPLIVPDEKNSAWDNARVYTPNDPALCFINVSGRWIPTSVNSNLLPATDFTDLSGKYFDGIVTLRWATRFEENCRDHIIERSTNGIDWQQLATVTAARNSQGRTDYEFFDTEVLREKEYAYRIVNRDIYGYTIRTNNLNLSTADAPSEFPMEVFFGKRTNTWELNVRFMSRKSQRIRIKILDEQFREVAIIYDGFIEQEAQNLLKMTDPLPPSTYYVVADTESKRYFEVFTVEE